MKNRSHSKIAQGNLLQKTLMEQLNPKHPLMILAKNIPWDSIETQFEKFYSTCGRPAKPIRLMSGLLLLKHLENLSDERLIEMWVSNPYYQYFCGYHEFQWRFPCDPTDLVYFRRRIGEEGCRELFNISVGMHGDKAKESDVIVDSTVQEKNITFPTDSKQHLKIIAKCRKIARLERITLRRSYAKELRARMRTLRFAKGKSTTPQQRKARKRVKTIAGILLRDLSRKLTPAQKVNYKELFELFDRVLQQKKGDKKKHYSLHEPQTACFSKGKAHKRHEYGSKVSVAATKTDGIIVGIVNFSENIHDTKTLEATIASIQQSTGEVPERILADRGYRGVANVGTVSIRIPDIPAKDSNELAKEAARELFRRRSSIEPIIGHLKSDFRMGRNYLKGIIGDAINCLLAATCFNLRKWLRDQPLCLYFALRRLLRHFATLNGVAVRLDALV